MKARIFFVVIACGWSCAAANGALYEFTIGGQVTQSDYPGVNVGDLFTIGYVADSRPHSDPINASYPASEAVVTFPGVAWDSYYESAVGVYLNDLGMNRVFYRTPSESILFDIEIFFPSGTLRSNALPLTLPMDRATSATLRLTDYLGSVRGTLATYDSVEVPAPVGTALPASVLLTGRIYKRRGYMHSDSHATRAP